MFNAKEHEQMRRQLWVDMCISTVNANDCKQTSTPISYADAALKAFDERFTETHTRKSGCREKLSSGVDLSKGC